MKKYELVKALAEKLDVNQTKANDFVDAFIETVVNTCVDNGDEVNLPGLGKFKQKVNKARKGINPLTKAPLDVKESHTLKFTPTTSIKKIIEPKKGKK